MTRTTCKRPRCPRAIRARGLRYAHASLAGVTRRPATRARLHVGQLRDIGWTFAQIADAAGVHRNTVRYLDYGHHDWIQEHTERVILAVRPAPFGALRMPSSVGLRRRVRALACMGWTAEEVASRAGTTAGSLYTLISPNQAPSYRYAQRVAEVYRQLAYTPGPSTRAAATARTRGFAPPAAWDDDIDDPDAQPAVVEGEVVDEVAIQRVLSGHANVALTELERVELARIHVARGGSATALARIVGVGHKVANRLIAQAEGAA